MVEHFRFGSLADISQRKSHVHFTPNSGRAGCLIWAISANRLVLPQSLPFTERMPRRDLSPRPTKGFASRHGAARQ